MKKDVELPKYRGDQPCNTVFPETFFPEDNANVPRVDVYRNMCRNHCPYYTDCYEWAIHHEEFGFWAGTTPRDREAIRRQRGIRRSDPYARLYLWKDGKTAC